MKYSKIISKILLLLIILSFSITNGTLASTEVLNVLVDGEKVEFDVSPVKINNRVLVPLRGVFEKLGAKVDWNKNIQEVVIKDENNEIEMLIDNNKVMVNGQVKDIDVAVKLVNSRAFAPIRFITESLGHEVKWDEKTNTVHINKKISLNNYSNNILKVGSKENLLALLEYNSRLYNYIWLRGGAAPMATASSNGMLKAQAAETTTAKTDSSDTNNQVEGVQEGDIIKNDGKYIFLKSNSGLKIINSDPKNPSILSTVNVPENTIIDEIFIKENKLVVVGQNNFYQTIDNTKSSEKAFIMPLKIFHERTNVLVYNIENKQAPKLEREYLFDGSYSSGREIDGNLYLVTNKYINYSYDNNNLETPTPYYTDVISNTRREFAYDEISYFPSYVDSRYMYTIGINLMDANQEVDVDVYLGGTDIIYSSKDSLFVLVSDYSYDHNMVQTEKYMPGYTTSTVVYKFSYNKGTIDLGTQSKVPGTIINQFSMDEKDGIIRIATTTGDMWSDTSNNNLYILDSNLKIIGKLENLAPGERIYSTRFGEDRVYMVTFKQVDPLFVINTKNPQNPMVEGILKIPGYSTYLHIVDDNHLLGFGYETKETQWGGTVNEGMKITMFDVSNVNNPVEKVSENIGKAGTSSDMLYNHKALMYSLNKNIMAFPIKVAKENYIMEFNGAYIYDITNNSFAFKNKISHVVDAKYSYQYDIKRIIYIGDSIYTFSDTMMQVHTITSNEKLSQLDIK